MRKLKIQKVDDKPMVIHTKKKAKLHTHEPKKLFKEAVDNAVKLYSAGGTTVNDVLLRHCRNCGISEIYIHGLRHTHASLLLFAGVSIASVARRLGHASMTTTQKTYLHIIQELENKDVNLVMRTLSGL